MPSRNTVTAVDVTGITYAHPNFAGFQDANYTDFKTRLYKQIVCKLMHTNFVHA